MKDFTIIVLDAADHKFIWMLMNLGAPRKQAFVIAYLKNVGEASSREIELGTGISYAEVTKAIHAMSDLGWIESRESKRVEGRRNITYSLKSSLEGIIDHFSKEKLLKNEQLKESIIRLKQLAKS
jgi:predicted transcriptional regulator